MAPEDPSRTQSSQHSQRAVSELSRISKRDCLSSDLVFLPVVQSPCRTTPTSKGMGLCHHSSRASQMAESSNFGPWSVLPVGPRALLIQSNIPEHFLNFGLAPLSPKAPAGLGWSTGTLTLRGAPCSSLLSSDLGIRASLWGSYGDCVRQRSLAPHDQRRCVVDTSFFPSYGFTQRLRVEQFDSKIIVPTDVYILIMGPMNILGSVTRRNEGCR